MKRQSFITVLLVIAQFFGTSLWFVGNVVVPQHPVFVSSGPEAVGGALSAVQVGFIAGTLLIAFLNLADKFKPTRIFFICCALGGLCNMFMFFTTLNSATLIASRFAVGMALAGIYPVGIKIVSDFYREGLGKALGFLVGALVLGTAFPHFLNAVELAVNYKMVVTITTTLAIAGGLTTLLLVPDGPFAQTGTHLKVNAALFIFRDSRLLKAAWGYWGHMWELYAFWAFLPVFISGYLKQGTAAKAVSLLSFEIIAVGSLACVFAGYLSKKWGSNKTARTCLVLSGVFCVSSPFLYMLPFGPFVVLLLFWGAVVVADSAQFSSMVALASSPQQRGTAITLVNCIGFAITVMSLQLLSFLAEILPANYIFLPLAIGPVIGILLSGTRKIALPQKL